MGMSPRYCMLPATHETHAAPMLLGKAGFRAVADL
jgi:hypothetical protein